MHFDRGRKYGDIQQGVGIRFAGADTELADKDETDAEALHQPIIEATFLGYAN